MPTTEIIYGPNAVMEALRAGLRTCHELYVSLGRKESTAERLARAADAKRVPMSFVSKAELSKLAGTSKHQGVAARVDPYPYAQLEEIVRAAVEDPQKAFILVLDGVSDPHNLGSLVRTAYLMGAHGVVLPRDNAACVTPVAVKASAGATEHLPLAQVTNLARTVRFLKETGIWVAGVEAEGEKSIYDNNFKWLNVALVLGSEGGGIRRVVKESCDFLMHIPMKGEVSSYNVSVAGALAMGEVARQRSKL